MVGTIEVTSGCYAVPCRNKRRCKPVQLLSGTIVERATQAMLDMHVPHNGKRIPYCIPITRDEKEGYCSFSGFALLNAGDVAILYGGHEFLGIGETAEGGGK